MILPGSKEIVSEFQERRARTGHLLRPWIISGAIGFGAVALVLSTPFPDSVEWRFGLLFGGFLVGAISIAGANSAVSAHYRCPVCGRTVSDDRGVPVDPDTCPRCGAVLK